MLRELHYKDALVAAVIVLVAGGYGAWMWLAPRPEEEIRACLDRLAEAAANADPRGLSAELAPDYRGELASRQELLDLVQAYLDEYGPTDISLTGVRVTVQGDLALAEVTARSQAQRRDKWGAVAESAWRIIFAQYGGRWYIEDIVPLAVMGQDVQSFAFRQELRAIAEQELAEATERHERQARRLRETGSNRFERARRQREALAERYPPDEEVWLLDDFEDGGALWSPEDWGHPVKMAAEPFEGAKRLKLEVGRSEKEKAAIGRAVLVDFACRGAVRVDAYNAAESEAELALAVMAQNQRGRVEWFETRPTPLPPGEHRSITFDLLADDFKTQRTRWRHRAAIPSPGTISRLYILVYTNLGGTFYLDNVAALRAPDGADDPSADEAPAAGPAAEADDAQE